MSGEDRSQCLQEGLKGAVDLQIDQFGPEVGRDLARTAAALHRAVAGRHPRGVHVLRTQAIRGDRGHQRGIDAAGEPHHGVAESVLAHVVARPQRERPIDFLGGIQRFRDGRPQRRPRPRSRRGDVQSICFDRPLIVLRRPHGREQPVTAHGLGVNVAVDEVLFELCPAGQPRAGVVEDHAHAVKDQLILPADQVVVAEGDAVVAGPRGQHLGPFAPLAGVVGGAVDVDDHERPRGRFGLAGASGGPDILANGHADRDAFNDEYGGAAAGMEVALLVEHAVVRQALLMVDADPLAIDAHRRRIVEVGALVHESHHHGDARGAAGDLFQRGQIATHEVGFEQQIFGGISGNREFGEADEVRAQIARAVNGLADTAGIALQVPHRRIDLGHAHT